MAFEDVPAGQELHCRCETLINYEEMKGASLGSFESVELILVLTHSLAMQIREVSVSAVQ